ncbi:DnaT-like ssDNA-binding domain-containing protein [Escherichia coli]|uniref:DnaT-like ssDNA-binding domain-containing protein n=1 Tax=Escherichia coli TaxID=562 RepID=UPI001AECD526|nr:DnaT-like ssDNA-binding domain-containing protein [Escherichia coli]MBP2745293.1 primosomal protein [Escherichia coli]
MARIRTIKPEFWTDEDMAELSEPACLLAIGLLNYADDEGYFNANPKLIKAAVFPIREPSVPIPVLIQELSNCGYLSMFSTSDGKQFGAITNFLKHQVVNKPKESKIKCLPLIPYEYGTDTGQVPLGMDQGTGIRESKTPLSAREEIQISPVVVPGIGEPIGKFTMHENWQPSDDFVMRARMWGHALPADGYKKSDLIEFITYWMAEGNVMQHVQWEQKFARLLMNRRKRAAGKRGESSDDDVPHWNSPEGWKDFL